MDGGNGAPRAFLASGELLVGEADSGIDGGRFRPAPNGGDVGGDATNSYSSTAPAPAPTVTTPSAVKRLFRLESRVDMVRPAAELGPGWAAVSEGDVRPVGCWLEGKRREVRNACH